MRKMILFTLAATVATAAFAADGAQPGQQQGGWQRPDAAQMQQFRAKMEARRAQMQARRASDVALLLGLRPDQRPALDAYLAAMRPQHKWGQHQMGGMGQQQGGEPGTLAQLDKMAARADQMDAKIKQRIEATRAFYSSLSPDQQQRFDALRRLRREGKMRHRWGMMHRRGGMMGHGMMGHGGQQAPNAQPAG